MRIWVIAVAGLVSGCSGFGPTAAAPCYVPPVSFNGDDPTVFMRMSMLNVRRYCGVTISTDRRAGEATGQITKAPTHGRARVRRNSTGVAVVEYLPQPGFEGSDELRARLGSGGRTITLDIFVLPAPPPS